MFYFLSFFFIRSSFDVALPAIHMKHIGKIRKIDKYYSGNPYNGSKRRRSPLFKTLCWKCTNTNSSHGNVARQAKINDRTENVSVPLREYKRGNKKIEIVSFNAANQPMSQHPMPCETKQQKRRNKI